MSSTRNPGRFAGLLYLLTGIPGFFAIEYVPGKLIVHGNAVATASNIAPSETLFRLGIAAQLISQAGFIFVALALYDLLNGINRRHASLMVTLVVVQIPIAFLNELNSIAALALVRGADFLSIFEKPQRDAVAMHQGCQAASAERRSLTVGRFLDCIFGGSFSSDITARAHPSFASFASRTVLLDRTERADFFFPLHSREAVGSRPAAVNSPKHMRQRCRAMRFAPRTPPRSSMRTSSDCNEFFYLQQFSFQF